MASDACSKLVGGADTETYGSALGHGMPLVVDLAKAFVVMYGLFLFPIVNPETF